MTNFCLNLPATFQISDQTKPSALFQSGTIAFLLFRISSGRKRYAFRVKKSGILLAGSAQKRYGFTLKNSQKKQPTHLNDIFLQ